MSHPQSGPSRQVPTRLISWQWTRQNVSRGRQTTLKWPVNLCGSCTTAGRFSLRKRNCICMLSESQQLWQPTRSWCVSHSSTSSPAWLTQELGSGNGYVTGLVENGTSPVWDWGVPLWCSCLHRCQLHREWNGWETSKGEGSGEPSVVEAASCETYSTPATELLRAGGLLPKRRTDWEGRSLAGKRCSGRQGHPPIVIFLRLRCHS